MERPKAKRPLEIMWFISTYELDIMYIILPDNLCYSKGLGHHPILGPQYFPEILLDILYLPQAFSYSSSSQSPSLINADSQISPIHLILHIPSVLPESRPPSLSLHDYSTEFLAGFPTFPSILLFMYSKNHLSLLQLLKQATFSFSTLFTCHPFPLNNFFFSLISI